MIGMITGQVAYLSAPVVCVMTNGGVGYEIELPIPIFCTLDVGATISLFTYLYVREDAHLLFGFSDKNEREIFKKLIKINGVGAKMALAILSTLPAQELRHAVEYNDESALIRVAGVGKKTAQRLIIELKDKLSEFDGMDKSVSYQAATPQNNSMQIVAEVELALLGLGYKEKEAQGAIKLACVDLGDDFDVQTLLKNTLRQLAK